jgi:hypothetical protein
LVSLTLVIAGSVGSHQGDRLWARHYCLAAWSGGICAHPPMRNVKTSTADEHIMIGVAVEDVIAAAPKQPIVAFSPHQTVVPCTAPEHVVAIVPKEPVMARPTLNAVITRSATEPIVPFQTIDDVVPLQARNDIFLWRPYKDIVFLSTNQRCLHPVTKDRGFCGGKGGGNDLVRPGAGKTLHQNMPGARDRVTELAKGKLAAPNPAAVEVGRRWRLARLDK